MPAILNVVAFRGRRRKASREGTRGMMRTEGAGGYGDLGIRAGPARRRRGVESQDRRRWRAWARRRDQRQRWRI